jgi:hypothetical protein
LEVDLQFCLACIRKTLLKEVSMPSSVIIRALFLLALFFMATNTRAQSQLEEADSLPISLSTDQFQSLQQLSPAVNPDPAQPRVRRRLPRPVLPLTPEEISYRNAVQKLGIHRNRFVHCELPNSKVRTGVITEIRDDGFMLKDGIFISQWIPYTDLKAAPRPVPAVGTRIGQGFKWAGVGLGVALLIPLFPLFFIAGDGC